MIQINISDKNLKWITNPLLLPLIITIIPLIWYVLISLYDDPIIISVCLGIVEALLIGVQGLIWYVVFQQRKGTEKTFQHALRAKNVYKFVLLLSGMFLVMLYAIDYLAYNTILNETNVHTVDQAKHPVQKLRMDNTAAWVFFTNIFTLLFLLLLPDRNYGQSYAYFRTTTIEKREFSQIARFQKGMKFYDEHLAVTFDLRIKNMDQIQSSMIFSKFGIRDNELQKLIASFTDDQLEPARFLSQISEIPSKDFFHKQTDSERFEKYIKLASPFIPIIVLIVTLAYNYLQK